MKNQLTKLGCTFFFAGYFPIAPGTFASLITVAIIWFLIPPVFYILLPAGIGLLFLSVWLATRGEKLFGKDGSPIVIDEVAGMKLKGGWGVTLDDVMAGIYANLSLHLILYLAG